MVKDLGVQREQRRTFGFVATAIFAPALIGTAIWDWRQHRDEDVAVATTWTVAGPACPAASPWGSEAAALRQGQGVAFGSLATVRLHGAIHCRDVVSDGGRGQDLLPICQFDHPGVLGVRAAGRLMVFSPGPGVPATVSAAFGHVRCVIGATANFGHALIYRRPDVRPRSASPSPSASSR